MNLCNFVARGLGTLESFDLGTCTTQLEQRTPLRAWPNYGPSTYLLSLLYRKALSQEVTTSMIVHTHQSDLIRLLSRDHFEKYFVIFEVAILR